MPPDFYSDRDKQIYEQYQFIPQQKYLSTPFQLPEPPGVEPPESGSGISTLPVYMGGGSGGAPADVKDLLFDYQNAINKRQRLLENPGTFAQKIYDMGFPKQRSVEQMMRDAGATEVHMMIASPPIIYPDYYGIDTPVKEELLAANNSLKEICSFIGADSVVFLSVDGLYKAMGYPKGRDNQNPQFTDHCFTGDYPTDLKAVSYTHLTLPTKRIV